MTTELNKSRAEKVAVLCCSRNSVYKSIEGLDCYDVDRDARTFRGGMPVIAHPPCRLWSAYCSHQAKSDDPDAERALGVWCADQVEKWGGVLEQPAHSRLFDAAELPKPGRVRPDAMSVSWSIELPQYWFGDSREKNTWLYFSKIPINHIPPMPIRLKPDGGDRRIWQLMSKNERERTPRAFAEWLFECVKLVRTTCAL